QRDSDDYRVGECGQQAWEGPDPAEALADPHEDDSGVEADSRCIRDPERLGQRNQRIHARVGQGGFEVPTSAPICRNVSYLSRARLVGLAWPAATWPEPMTERCQVTDENDVAEFYARRIASLRASHDVAARQWRRLANLRLVDAGLAMRSMPAAATIITIVLFWYLVRRSSRFRTRVTRLADLVLINEE